MLNVLQLPLASMRIIFAHPQQRSCALQGPTPEDVIVASAATAIEEMPSTGSAGRRLAAAASVAEVLLRPNAESDVDFPAENAPHEALTPAALVPRRRRTVLRPMRGATADQHV